MPTFAAAAEAVLAQMQPGWHNPKHGQDWLSSMERFAFPRLGKLPVSEVTSANVVEALRAVWHERRVRQHISTVMEWAVALNYRDDNLQSIPDGDGTLLDGTVVLYGSGMSDGNIHNNYNVPVVVVGGPERGLKGNRHLVYPKGTPLANLSLSLMAKFGVREEQFGDSTGRLPLLSGV